MFERQSQISRGADNIRLDALLRTSDGQRHGSLDVGRIARLQGWKSTEHHRKPSFAHWVHMHVSAPSPFASMRTPRLGPDAMR